VAGWTPETVRVFWGGGSLVPTGIKPRFFDSLSRSLLTVLSGLNWHKVLKIEERTQDTLTYLPAVSEIEIDATGVDVHDGEDKQVGAHTEVGKGEVAHEELGHGELQHVTEQHEKNGQVAYHSRDDDKPHTDTQPREAHDVLTRVQRVGLWSAHDKDRAARNTWKSVLQGMNPRRI